MNRIVACSALAVLLALVGCKKDRRRPAQVEPENVDTLQEGVSETRINVGQFAAFTGPAAGLGTEMWRGAQAYFTEVNQTGGVFERRIELVLRDDTYEPQPAVAAFKELVENEKVFALFGAVGTPTLFAVLPELERHRGEHLALVANFTGAQKQREAPYLDQVFNVRAGYQRETQELVEQYSKLGHRKIGVYMQDDSYGEAGLSGVKLAIQKLNAADPALKLHDPIIAKYPRGQKFDVSTAKQVEQLRAAGADAIVGVGAYQACAAFVRDARTEGYVAPITNVSFAGADTLLRLLNQYEKDSNKKVVTNLFNSQVVPNWESVEVPVVGEYRRLVDKHRPMPPSALQDATYRSLTYSFGALEGFVSAKVFVEGLRRAGKDITRAKFVTSLQSIKDWDPGLGAGVTYGPTDNQGLDRVWLTAAKDGAWVSVNDLQQVDRVSVVRGGKTPTPTPTPTPPTAAKR